MYDIAAVGTPVEVLTRMEGCAGAMALRGVLPADGLSTVQLGDCFPEVSIVDFSRLMVIVRAEDVGVSDDTDMDHPELCERLERIRLAAALTAGLGDCSGRDSPKLCAIAPPRSDGAHLRVWYWVNPGRCEGHPSLAITGASCLAAACEIRNSVAYQMVNGSRTPLWKSEDDAQETAEYCFEHSAGHRRVTLWRRRADQPTGVSYRNEVRIIATGDVFLQT
eukprot:gnl/TRDRNA2_/TRDRNA2_155565_c0_seq1.p1 gnl/TRDRNA2_/TRDRNA2_155565_c0~~gnl/TRDRNA2_/TRDRNA2_155565_c0_seq1.p1  ORF type:complete len:221 (+),score=25.79 gnl/TRDRNA2_/TRDRNA2_155565_c0_seq1:20-682(+)